MACGGLTVYSPMRRGGVTKGTKLGVAGLGGLGAYYRTVLAFPGIH